MTYSPSSRRCHRAGVPREVLVAKVGCHGQLQDVPAQVVFQLTERLCIGKAGVKDILLQINTSLQVFCFQHIPIFHPIRMQDLAHFRHRRGKTCLSGGEKLGKILILY